MTRLTLFVAAFILCATYAYKSGGQPERAAIAAQGIALIITFSTGLLSGSDDFSFMVWGWLGADLLLMVALLGIALRANRIWTIVLAGLHLAALFAHLAKALHPQLSPFAYALFLQFWGWPMLTCTAIGVRSHQKRRAQALVVPDWKNSPGRFFEMTPT